MFRRGEDFGRDEASVVDVLVQFELLCSTRHQSGAHRPAANLKNAEKIKDNKTNFKWLGGLNNDTYKRYKFKTSKEINVIKLFN